MAVDSHIPPRSFLSLFLRLGGWILLVTLLPVAVISWVAVVNASIAKRFEVEAVHVTAQILDHYFTVSTDSDGDKTTTYWLDLEYPLENGTPYQRRKSVPRWVYDETETGGTYEISYLRSDPERIQLYDGEYARGSRVAQMIGLIGGGIWLGFFWWVGRKTVAGLRARMYGARVEVPSLGATRTNVRVNNKPRYRIRWVTPDGTPGQSLMRKGSGFEGADQEGAMITVYRGLRGDWWAGDVGNRPEG